VFLKSLEQSPALSQTTIKFHNVNHEPVKLLTYHHQLYPELDIQHILVVPQLHLIFITNILVGWLVRLSEPLATEFICSLNGKPNPRRGFTDFLGHDCRKSTASSEKLRQMTPTAEHIEQFTSSRSSSSSHREGKSMARAAKAFECVHKLCDLFQALDLVVHRTRSTKLHDNWTEGFNKFRLAFSEFSPTYSEFMNISKNRNIETPKIHLLMNFVEPTISHFGGRSLCFLSEQAFETIHSTSKCFERNFKVPRTGFKKDQVPQKSSSSSVLFPKTSIRWNSFGSSKEKTRG
jgi:hypothetical protein